MSAMSAAMASSQTPMNANNKQAPFGEMIPWGDPAWYRGYNSPYYRASHAKLRAQVRAFVDKEIMPFCNQWDEAKKLPVDLLKKCAKAGWLPAVVGAPWPKDFAPEHPDIPAAEWDQFHELILIDELARTGSGSVLWGISGGLSIGLPPVLHFGSTELKRRVAPACLSGEKIICLAITEPLAGSDVANLRCTAKLDETGENYIVNGEKKWITNGVFADYFTVAVRTGGPGMGGISMLLIEKDMPGVICKQMQCMGVWASGTTYITFEDVKVPKKNLIGRENEGFKYIMYNFNHERWSIVAQATRSARVCLEESMRYAMKRRTFGKKLIEHPVIRWKLAEMARQVEATHAALEHITYQMSTMNKMEQMQRLGGDTALLKVQSTKVFEYCAREAAQIFGGASYVRGGQGEKVERCYREVRAYAIPGGSEEVMADLAVREGMKNYTNHLKKLSAGSAGAKM